MTSNLSAFRTTLEAHLAELLDGRRDREAIAINSSPDELDRIQHARDRDQSIRNLERDSRRLYEVRSALDRLEANRFGTCVGCDAAISPRRLKAVPWAALCIACQEAEEREPLESGSESEVPLAMTA